MFVLEYQIKWTKNLKEGKVREKKLIKKAIIFTGLNTSHVGQTFLATEISHFASTFRRFTQNIFSLYLKDATHELAYGW